MATNLKGGVYSVIRNLSLVGLIFVLSGCSGIMPSFSVGGGPRPRVGYMPISKSRIPFPDPAKLGKHSASVGLGEVGGMTFTCKGGHVDIDHIRGNADGTRYLAKKIQNTLSKNKKELKYKIGGEPSSHKITFTYPADWNKRPNKEQIINEIAYATAPYIEFHCTTWHEMLTWFGYHFALIEPEFNSAFSWEDNYSNCLGCIIGAEAAQDKQRSFDEAVTALIYQKLRELDVQPGEVGRAASEKVKGSWWIDGWVPDMKMRSFDIGLKGCITPVIVPGIKSCNGATPYCLPVPTLEVLHKYGFTMEHVVKPGAIMIAGKMYKAAGSKKIIPEQAYPNMIKFMAKEAAARGDKYIE